MDGVADEAGGAVVLESVDEESSVSEAESAASDSAIVCDGCTWLVSAESITLRNGQSLCPSCVSALTAARPDQPAPPTPVAVSRGMAPAGSSAKADTRSSPVESAGAAGAVRYRESEKPRRSLSVWRLPLWLYYVFALATWYRSGWVSESEALEAVVFSCLVAISVTIPVSLVFGAIGRSQAVASLSFVLLLLLLLLGVCVWVPGGRSPRVDRRVVDASDRHRRWRVATECGLGFAGIPRGRRSGIR